MKITKAELITVGPPMAMVFASKTGPIGTRRVIVKLHTEEGLTGVGEIDLVPAEWGHNPSSVFAMFEEFIKPHIIGKDPFDIEAILQEIDVGVDFRQTPELMLFERSGLDAALYDLMGKYCRVPVHKLIGGRVQEKAAVAWVLTIDKPEAMAMVATEYVEKGYFDFKLKVGLGMEEDVARVKAVREAVGDKVGVRVDVNGWWTPNEAVRAIRRMERYNIELVEQPVPRWDLKGLAYIRRHVDTPIMVDESLHSIQDALRIIEHEAADVFNIKFQRVGGLFNSRKIVTMAESSDIICMMGGEIELGVGTATALHLIASSSKFVYPGDLVGMHYFKDDIVKERFLVKDGYLEVPTKPGLGVELDDEKMRKYRVTFPEEVSWSRPPAS